MTLIFARDQEILDLNSRVIPYENTSAWSLYYWNPETRKYDFSKIRVDRFKKFFINTPRVDKDVFYTLNLEDPRINSYEDAQDYFRVMSLMRASGREVVVYGIDPDERLYQSCWNIAKHRDRQDVFRLKPFMKKLNKQREWAMKIADWFNPYIDYASSSAYLGYNDPGNFGYHLDYLNTKWELMRQAYPGKRHLVWLQPNYTVGFDPISIDVWMKLVDFATNHSCVDGIIVFSLREKEQAFDWERAFDPTFVYSQSEDFVYPAKSHIEHTGEFARRIMVEEPTAEEIMEMTMPF